MPAKGTKPVTEQLFNTVTSQLKAGNPTLGVAQVNGIKESTVRAIRQAKTWKEYQRRKAAKVAKMTAARQSKQSKAPLHIPVSSKRSYAKRVEVKRAGALPAPKAVSVDDIELEHVVTRADLIAMEERLQKHLDQIADVTTTLARDEAVHHHKVELLKPELHIARRLDNMDQSLMRIERVLQPVRRWFGVRRHG